MRKYVSRYPLTYLVGLVLVQAREFVRYTVYITLPDLIDKGIYLLGVALLLIYMFQVLTKERRVKRAAVYFVAVLIGFATYVTSRETVGITLTIIIFASSLLNNPSDSLRIITLVNLIGITLALLTYVMQWGLSPEAIQVFYRDANQMDTPRFAMGFAHPNVTAAVILTTLCSIDIIYDINNKIKWVVYALLGILVFYITRSNTTALLWAFYPIVKLLMHVGCLAKIITLSVSIFPSLALLITALVAGPLYSDSIATVLTYRLMLWHGGYVDLGLTLLGQPFHPTLFYDSAGLAHYCTTLDSAYATCLFVYGILFGAIVCTLYLLLLRLPARVNVEIVPALLIIALLGVTEVHALYILSATPLIMLALPIKSFGKKSINNYEVGADA